MAKEKNRWYAGGLHFECGQCGNCCSGPDEGYIWVTKEEIAFIADFLQINIQDFYSSYLMRVGSRYTIIEKQPVNDCIFLQTKDGRRGCSIYPVRPNQCRTWPFWASNLLNPNSWNEAAQKCGGINRGQCHSHEQIESKKEQKKWWE